MAEALNQEIRLFRAEMNDGSMAAYKATWQGYADMNWHEDGGPSTWTHPVDDRRCSWTVTGYVIRRVGVEIAGQDYWNDIQNKVFDQHQEGQGNAFVLQNLHPENCGDCANRRDSDYRNMKDYINGTLGQVRDGDIDDVIASIQDLPGVVRVNV